MVWFAHVNFESFFYISIVSSRGRGNVEGLGNFKCAYDDADDG